MAEDANSGNGGGNQGSANQNNDHSNNGNNQNPALTNNAPDVSHSLKGTLEFLAGGKASAEFKKDIEDYEKQNGGGGENQNNNNQNQNQNQQNEGGDQGEGDKGAAEPAKKPDPKLKEIETPLFGKQKLGEKKPGEKPVEFKEFSEIQEYVKTNYGAEDVNKFLTESVPKFREQAQKLGETEKKVTEFTNIFEKLPETLFNAVKAHITGNDWKEEINKAPKLDFNKKVDDHDKKILVETYFPGKFSKDDFDSEEENKGLEIAYEAAKRSYVSDKTGFDGKRQAMIENESKRQEAFTRSVGSSVDKLKNDLPHVNEMALKDVSQLMEEGPQAIFAELFNDDGSYKEDAATKIAMLKHGFKTMETYMKIAANQAETEVNETFVAKAPDKIQNQTPGGDNKLSKALTSGLAVLNGLNRGKTY